MRRDLIQSRVKKMMGLHYQVGVAMLIFWGGQLHRGEGYSSDVDCCDILLKVLSRSPDIRQIPRPPRASWLKSVSSASWSKEVGVIGKIFSLKLAKNSESSKFYLR